MEIARLFGAYAVHHVCLRNRNAIRTETGRSYIYWCVFYIYTYIYIRYESERLLSFSRFIYIAPSRHNQSFRRNLFDFVVRSLYFCLAKFFKCSKHTFAARHHICAKSQRAYILLPIYTMNITNNQITEGRMNTKRSSADAMVPGPNNNFQRKITEKWYSHKAMKRKQQPRTQKKKQNKNGKR